MKGRAGGGDTVTDFPFWRRSIASLRKVLTEGLMTIITLLFAVTFKFKKQQQKLLAEKVKKGFHVNVYLNKK